MGVKFVTPKEGDAVAVVTRSVESPEEVLEEATATITPAGESGSDVSTGESDESPDVAADATIVSGAASPEVSPESENGPAVDPESEG
jgi:DNA gyrase subunit A